MRDEISVGFYGCQLSVRLVDPILIDTYLEFRIGAAISCIVDIWSDTFPAISIGEGITMPSAQQ